MPSLCGCVRVLAAAKALPHVRTSQRCETSDGRAINGWQKLAAEIEVGSSGVKHCCICLGAPSWLSDPWS
jgi:hypothetical protein